MSQHTSQKKKRKRNLERWRDRQQIIVEYYDDDSCFDDLFYGDDNTEPVGSCEQCGSDLYEGVDDVEDESCDHTTRIASISKRWFEAKAGLIDSAEVEPAKDLTIEQRELAIRFDAQWCRCPCGGKDHLAYRRYYAEGLSKTLSPVVTCFRTNRQWLARPPDVAGIIESEERTCLALLARAPEIVKKVVKKRGWSKETAAFLRDTHGIDEEMAAKIVTGEWI